MKKYFLVLILVITTCVVNAQDTAKNERLRVLYIVDNVPIIDDPEEGSADLSQNDIAELTVITNAREIEKLGYPNIDKVLLLITKEYKNRPDDLKKVPTTKIMEKKDGAWYLKNTDKPYSGPFIDYYYNGKKQGEGALNDGKVNGLRTLYYANGQKKYIRTYKNGIADGDSEEYFTNGKLHQKGTFKNGYDEGLWIEYYSNGNIKRQMVFKDSKPQFAKNEKEFYDEMQRGQEVMKDEDYKTAIKRFDEAVKLNPNYADAYFYRGTAYFDNLDFDKAIADFDEAVKLEPLYMEAIANRAFARIRKYQFKNSRTLNKNSEGTILATKGKIDIPKEEQQKICADLNGAYELGDRKNMITDAISTYCK